MQEMALEHADPILVRQIDALGKTGDVILLTRNGQEVARIAPSQEMYKPDRLPGAEVARRFAALRARVRDHWPDEPEFDWKEAIQSGRR